MGTRWTTEEFNQELDRLGEVEVRTRLQGDVYGGPKTEKALLVHKWLWAREEQRRMDDATEAREAFRASSQADIAVVEEARRQSAFAEEANRIAEEANRLAESANTRATIAIVIAVIALIATTAAAVIPASPS